MLWAEQDLRRCNGSSCHQCRQSRKDNLSDVNLMMSSPGYVSVNLIASVIARTKLTVMILVQYTLKEYS
jgi:hypothetical protein